MDPSAERDLEAAIREIALALHRRAAGKRPAIFEPRDWLRRLIEQSLDDEAVRTALFRFVDVLPSLKSAREVGAHLEEYFERVDHALGGLTLLAHTLRAGWLIAPIVRHNVTSLARRFIAEERADALAGTLEDLRREPAAFTLDLVGEATVSPREALAMLARYRRLLAETAERAAVWPEISQIDRGPGGPLARASLSVKLSSLYARFDPLDPECERVATERLREILREARRLGAAIAVDMEQREFKDATLSIFRAALEDEELREGPAASIALQAYLPETERDLRSLLDWARGARRRIGVRLIKGAYWDSEIAWAEQKGWPIPVFTDKAETDREYEKLTRVLLDAHDVADAAFGSHNLRSLASATAYARALGLARGAYEIQMLYGMAEPLRHALVESGERVRVYLPVGDLIPGMAYLIRRLLENTSNVSFLRQTYVEDSDLERLIAAPAPVLRPFDELRAQHERNPSVRPDPEPRRRVEGRAPGEFRNEPLADYSREEMRERMGAALDDAHAAAGDFHALRIAGEENDGVGEIVSTNPAAIDEVIGRVAVADDRLVDDAVAAAAEAFPAWARTPIEERVAVLGRAAEEIRGRREALTAAIVLEVGKGWRDADAEVAEAIDYLEYYGREMRRIGSGHPTQRVLGETNEIVYEPLGVVAVIAPWNFPLAIPLGMTAAALVAGNSAILKPAEQSPVLGAELAEIFWRAGVPPAALSLVQGDGGTGAALVRHADVRAIAFTGSRGVGLEILRAAVESPSRFLKRVVCEMGGKNAIVVDEDADRDEAVLAILESAFGYQGQKCSAASRLIVVGEGYEAFVERVAEAARALSIGPPEDPRNAVGPLIEASALERVTAAIERGGRDGRLVGERSRRAVPDGGHFAAPAIVAELDPGHPLAQEEIFGPVLCTFAAASFEEAIELANGTPYGLTGGVFSRSPAHLEYARRELRVGNLYLNRGITGAVVGRQPFGGIKLSGAGWKAGGPDYLKQFLESRAIAENTLRHGFAPPEK